MWKMETGCAKWMDEENKITYSVISVYKKHIIIIPHGNK